MTLRQLRALAPYLPRVGRGAMLPAAATVGAALVLMASAFESWGSGPPIPTLRLVTVTLCASAVFLLDDEAAGTLASSPTSLRSRRGALTVLAATGVGMAWWGIVGLSAALLPEAAAACLAVVQGPLTVEIGALLAVAVVIASVAARRVGPTTAGIAAGPATVLLFVAATQLPRPWTLLPDGPSGASWTAAHERLLVVGAVAALMIAWAARDPWQRPRWTRAARHRTLATAALMVAVVAGVALRDAGTPSLAQQLDATVDDLVAAQGVDQLGVWVTGDDVQWSRVIGAFGTGGPEVGTLTVAEVGAMIESAQALVSGTATPREIETWTRDLAARPGKLADRLSAATPPGRASTWVQLDPRRAPPPTEAITEVRYLTDSDTTMVVMTGDALPPCGIAVADTLSAQLTR